MAGGIIARNDFRALMADGLKLIFDDYAGKMMPELDMYTIEGSNKAYEQELGFVGMGAPAINPELTIPRMDSPRQGRPVTYLHTKYGLGCAISFEAKEDDQYGKIAKSIVPELTTSFDRERNTQAAMIFNNGFTTQGYEPDGVSLFNAAHPLVRGGTSSNLLTSPLSVSGLQNGRILLRKILSESGKIMPMIGMILYVGPSLESLAEELVKSTTKPGQTGTGSGLVTTPSEVNLPWVRGLKVVVLNYMSDNGMWVLSADKSMTKVKWYDRKKLYSVTEINNKTEAVEMYARARWSHGFSDWRGLVGYAGT